MSIAASMIVDRRVYDVIEGMAYLSGHEDDEAVVYVLPESELRSFIAAHPIHYEAKERGLFIDV